MKFAATAVILLAATPAFAQKTSKIEPKAWDKYDKGVKWERSLDEAKARAAGEGKLVMLHQLVGDMNKEGC